MTPTTLAGALVGDVVPRLLQAWPVRVIALVLQFVLHLALLLGRLSGVHRIRLTVATGSLAHANSPCRLLQMRRIRRRRGPRVPLRPRVSALAAYRRRKACRPTIPCRAASANFPVPGLSAQCRSG